MANTNDFVAFAIGSGANVETPALLASDATLALGFQAGTASSTKANTLWRQSTSMSAMLGGFMAAYGPGNVQDNGNVATLISQFEAALVAYTATEGYVPISGGTMTGRLTLSADPTVALHAVTKQYVDNNYQVKGNYATTGASGQAPGTLIARRVFTSTTTYIPSPGTNRTRVIAVGAGGAGGGTNTGGTTSYASAGGGGGGGACASDITSGFAGQAITIGAAGAGAANVPGAAGGNTSFMGLIAYGGGGGALGIAVPESSAQSAGAGGGATGGNIFNAAGAAGGPGIAFYSNNQVSGFGGSSYLGAGASGVWSTNSAGIAGPSSGSGGSGAVVCTYGAPQVGGSGGNGWLQIEEYA